MRLGTMLFTSVLAAGWLTSGCGNKTDAITAPTSADSPSSPPMSGSCDASKAQWSIGQRASDELLERARMAAGATTARFLRPNQPITLEYFSWRLNLGLTEEDVVRSVVCG